jgi:hypothetical protein
MGFGILNVWIHDQFSPCKISDEFWYVNVSYCSGEFLEYCGKTYHGLDAKCGHAEFELPPGCYVVQAFQLHLIPIPRNKVLKPVITYSNSALVMVECDARACVHVYNHSFWWWIFLGRQMGWLLAQEKGAAGEKARQFADAADALLAHLPKSGHDEALERAAQETGAKVKPKGK